MSNPKVDLTKLSINQLETLTGSTYRTIKKILADVPPAETTGNAILYEAREALFLVFEAQGVRRPPPNADGVEILDPAQEKAKLDRKRTELVDLQLQEKKGILIPADEVEKTWSDQVVACRSKMLGIPNRLSAQLAVITDPHVIEAKLESTIREALNELEIIGSD